MKFSCYKDDLADVLKAVMPAVAVKPQTPILSCVYLKAEGTMLEVQGNNFTNGAIAKIPCSTDEPGEVVVGGKKFQEFIVNMPNRTVSCSVENNSLVAEAGGATATLLTMNVADFPKVKMLDKGNEFKIHAGTLSDLFRKTIFAVDKSKGARPIFTGVNFDFKDDFLTLTATNTHRLAIAKASLNISNEPFAFVVPATLLVTVISRLNPKQPDDFVTVNFTNRYMGFTCNNIFMTARLLEGVFPPTDKIIPTDSTTRVEVKVPELKEALNIVALVAKETEYNTIKLAIHGNMIELFANSPDIGDAAQTIEAVVSGADLNIAFNYSYLTDVLRAVDAPEINIAFNDPFSPALVTVPGDGDYVYVVTPVRT